MGEGAAFSVYFPCHKEVAEAEVSTVKQERLAGAREVGRILMVDDEPLLLTINARRLEALGYQVAFTESSQEALNLIKDDPDGFDLVITDQTMPELTGEDLAREVLQIKDSLPIIVCTGHSESFSKEQALAMGIKKYVLKPIMGDDLIDAVQETLQSGL